MAQRIEWPPLGPMTPEEFPAGDHYVGSYRGHEIKEHFEQLKIRLDFEIVEPPPYKTLLVPLFATYPALDRNRRPSRRSKFYQLWVMANGGLPKCGERMSMRVFEGYWQLRIRWGQVNGKPSTPVVDALLERVAGGPMP